MRSLCLTISTMICLVFCSSVWAEDFIASRSILVDPSATLSIMEVAHADFQPVGLILSKGYTDAAHWLRIVVRAPVDGDELVLRIRPTFIDDVTLFEPDPSSSNGWKMQQTGDKTPFFDRSRAKITLGFVIRPSEPETTYYLRLKTTSASMLHVQALRRHDAEVKDIILNLFQFSYFGLMLGGLFLAISYYLIQRDRVVAWFIFYQSIYLLYNLALLGYLALLIPHDFADLVDPLTSIVVCVLTLAGLLFNRALLAIFDPPRVVMHGLDALLLMVPIDLLIMALGHVRLALHINALLVLIAAPLLVIAAFGTRKEAAPGRKILRTMYVLIVTSLLVSILAFVNWVAAIEWNLQASLLQGLFSTSLMFLLLHMRFRHQQRQGEQATLNLVLSEKSLKIEQNNLTQQHRFMSMLSHELKTPLSVIRLILGFKKITDSDKQSGLKSAMDIDAVIDRCLQADQLEQQYIHLKNQPCQLAEILSELCTTAPSPQQLVMEYDTLPIIDTDYILLRIVLSNLVDNALKYSAPDTAIRINAIVWTQHNRSGVLVTISNQAGVAGMPDAQRVFSKYYRSEGAYSKTGSGLGLYLVSGMTKLLNGTVRYCPTHNDVRFELWLPV